MLGAVIKTVVTLPLMCRALVKKGVPDPRVAKLVVVAFVVSVCLIVFSFARLF